MNYHLHEALGKHAAAIDVADALQASDSLSSKPERQRMLRWQDEDSRRFGTAATLHLFTTYEPTLARPLHTSSVSLSLSLCQDSPRKLRPTVNQNHRPGLSL